MSTTADATLTDFLRDPNTIVDRLEHTDVVLHRRNAAALRLSLESRTEAVAEGVRFVARLLGSALTDESVRRRLEASTEAIPWLSFLPEQARHQFLAELFRTAEAAAELGVMTPLAQLVREWQATAAIYADPALAAELRRPLAGDGIPVPSPASR
ncbi:MAG: hypothetical protein WD830_12305 [Chloroflexota bacterium]